MTTTLVEILRRNPSITLGDLNQQLQKSLAGMAFDRIRDSRSSSKMYSAKLSPELQEKWEVRYTEKGLFEFRDQTAQFGSLQSLCQQEVFIVKKGYTLDLRPNASPHPF